MLEAGERGDDGLRHRFARDAANPTTALREVGGAGGLIVEVAGQPRVPVLFAGYSGEFAKAVDAAELVGAVELFCQALDFGYSYSATSTLHRLVEFTQGRARRLSEPPGGSAP